MVVVVSSGGALIVPVLAKPVLAGTAAVISEGALAAAGTAAVVEGAGLSTAIAAENLVIALTGLTVPSIWNPVGWTIGGVLVGASQPTSQVVTWGCYKPIIGEIDAKETSIKPIAFADLAGHPEVRRVSVFANAATANLSNVEVENRAEQYYLLRGVILPWGSAAYHTEPIDDSICTIPSYASSQGSTRARSALIGSTARQMRMRRSQPTMSVRGVACSLFSFGLHLMCLHHKIISLTF
ncbi:hypothetical protein F5884DRAFT_810511 [Xylogone sp. PMI_703]|nr:hypothetical protein F5884DRAFT_810511 [Xylogone sp. PMI_703]